VLCVCVDKVTSKVICPDRVYAAAVAACKYEMLLALQLYCDILVSSDLCSLGFVRHTFNLCNLTRLCC
jgi:hypothetical protein